MKFRNSLTGISVLLLLATFAAWVISRPVLADTETGSEQALNSLAALQPIDVHVHVFKTDPAFQAFLERLHLTLVNILVVDDTLSYRKRLEPQVADALALVRSSRGHIALCTTFDPYKFNDDSFQRETIKQLDENFAQDALAVKIWKNIGMEIKIPTASSSCPMIPSSPLFTRRSPSAGRHSCRMLPNRTSLGARLIHPILRGPTTRKIHNGIWVTKLATRRGKQFWRHAIAYWPAIPNCAWSACI